MQDLINFEYEYYQDSITILHCNDDTSSFCYEENFMNEFPSICEVDTTEAIKKKFKNSTLLDKSKNGFSLEPNSEDLHLLNLDLPSTNEISMASSSPRNKESQKEFEEVKSEENSSYKEEDSESSSSEKPSEASKEESENLILDTLSMNFKNPVNYEKNQRLSKKYDKGKVFTSFHMY